MKVALVQCPVWGVDDPPLALAQMAGCLKHAGHEAVVFDLNIGFWNDSDSHRDLWDQKNLKFWLDQTGACRFFEAWPGFKNAVSEIVRQGCEIVAFSVALGSQWPCLAFARALKMEFSGSTAIFGGSYFLNSQNADEFIKESCVDIVVTGAGDDVFVKLVGLYKASKSWVPLPGVVIKSGEGEIKKGMRPVSFTFDLDTSPTPDFSHFKSLSYRKSGQLPFSGSRGCDWHCAFCASREYWAKYSFKGGDRLFSEVVACREQFMHVNHIKFYDIMANGNLPSLVRFSENILNHHGDWGEVTWEINAAVKPDMTRDALRKMGQSGCVEIVYGIESGSPEVLNTLNKAYSLDLAERVLKDTHESGIRSVASFVLGAPSETDDDFDLTVGFLNRARPWLSGVVLQALELEEPSRMQQNPHEFGITVQTNAQFPDWTLDRAQDFCYTRKSRVQKLNDVAVGMGLAVRNPAFTIN